MLLLLPLKTELQPLFAGIIDECNQYGNFLHENMIITNVKKLTDEEIMHLLHAKNKRNKRSQKVKRSCKARSYHLFPSTFVTPEPITSRSGYTVNPLFR